MTKILHITQQLSRGGAGRSLISTAKYSQQLGNYQHQVISLNPADQATIELAQTSQISVMNAPREDIINQAIEQADIVQCHFWNSPELYRWLRSPLPAMRLLTWFHIAGNQPPQIIPEKLIHFSDFALCSSPYTADLPLFQNLPADLRQTKTGMVYDTTDFQRLGEINLRQHQGFNVGYIGTVDLVKMHPNYVPMSAKINIPEVKFIVCGHGNDHYLKYQAEQLGVSTKFDWRGYVEDIKSVIEILDIFGYPLCEDNYSTAELVLQEAMYAGVPPVIFPYGGASRTVINEQTGLIVHSELEYQQAIEYLYHHPEVRKKLGANARQYVQENFGAENSANGLNNIYQKLLTLPKRQRFWGINTQESLLNQPISLSDLTGESQVLTGSQLFIESLGDRSIEFEISMQGGKIDQLLKVDQYIAQGSPLLASAGAGGIWHYRNHYPQDVYLRFWSGLLLQQRGKHQEAIREFTYAINSGFAHWRINWYLATSVVQINQLDLAKISLQSVINSQPDFQPAKTLLAKIQPSALSDHSTVNQPKIKVSAIVSTYNSEAFFAGCLEDLVNQTLYQTGELEIIIIDSNSRENEGAIARQYQGKYQNIIYQRTDQRETLYSAWNRGIKLAEGKYITNANTDDRHRPDALEIMANYLDQHTDTAVVYADQLLTINPYETWANNTAEYHWNWPDFTYEHLEKCCIVGPQPMWRKSLHEEYGYFLGEFTAAADYEFWLRIGKTVKISKLPEILGLYYHNKQGLSLSSNNAVQELAWIWRKYGMQQRGMQLQPHQPQRINPVLLASLPYRHDQPAVEQILNQSSNNRQSNTGQSNKGKIVLYTDDFGIYGVGQYNHSLLLGLAKEGYQIICVQSHADHPLIEVRAKAGIQHWWLEYDTIKLFSRTLTDGRDAEQILANIQPDFVIFSDCCPFSNLAAKRVVLKSGVPYSVIVHCAVPYLAERFNSYLPQLANIYAKAQAVITVSQANLGLLRQLYCLSDQQGIVIYSGRPVEFFQPRNLQTSDRLRQELNIPRDAIVCFTAARLEAGKGFQYQLSAIQRLKQSDIWDQLYFIWAGDGSLKPQLTQALTTLGVNDHVRLLGQRSDISDLLDAADIFILPSEFDALGLAIVEAMAKGLPAIATNVGGIPEVLGDTGRLLPNPHDGATVLVEKLIETIANWSRDADLRKTVGIAGQTRAAHLFTESRMVANTVQLINDMMANCTIAKNSIQSNSVMASQGSLVSVIIFCGQQVELLPEAVASVVVQIYPDWEILIVNGSNQPLPEEMVHSLKWLSPKHQIQVIGETAGYTDGMNLAISQATGTYICPLDSRDQLSFQAIVRLVNVMETGGKEQVIFGAVASRAVSEVEQRYLPSQFYSLQNIQQYNLLGNTCLFTKNIWLKVGGYKNSPHPDWQFWLDCHAYHIPFTGIDETILYCHLGGNSPASKLLENPGNQLDMSSVQVITDDQLLATIEDLLKSYQQNSHNQNIVSKLRQARHRLASLWLQLPTENLHTAYKGSIGQAHQKLVYSSFKYELLTEVEINLVEKIKTVVKEGFEGPQAVQYFLAGMLYRRADQLPLNFINAPIPNWLVNDYLKFMFASPALFQEIGEANNYVTFLEKWLGYVLHNISTQPHSQIWQAIAQLFSQIGNFIPVYFAESNLKNLYSLRGKILEFYLKNQGCVIDYNFPARNRQKIRLGILCDHYNPLTETFLGLPTFEYLDRNKFEIILYGLQLNHHTLEQYCESRADKLIKLPTNLLDQVNTIRNDDLDILLVTTNVTAIAKSATYLMTHRLARIQTSVFASPVTTGIRNIDYFISGQLSEIPEQAQDFYTEKIKLLEGVGICFNYYAIPAKPAQIQPNRASWGADEETLVFISGANFYKIIPEQGETWAKILAQVPNSILLLYPFAPSWSRNYPGIPFMNRMHATFTKYGVDTKRLVLIKALPSRQDVKECLKLADIYLDSYPHSGGSSLIDPLEVGLPTVVRDGVNLRSKHGAGILRSLALDDLVGQDENSYINIAVNLATNQGLRQAKRQEIQAKMQQNPSVLDSRDYGQKIGNLLIELCQEWQSIHGLNTAVNTDTATIQNNANVTDPAFLRLTVKLVNQFKRQANNPGLIQELRQIRYKFATFWLQVPPTELANIYQGELQQTYQIFLRSGIQHLDLLSSEEAILQQLTELSMGLLHPQAVNAFLGGMLYFVPGKMLVKNADQRLPAWLLADYQVVFEEAFQADPANAGLTKQFVKKAPAVNFLPPELANQIIGNINLYQIDQTDNNIINDLRKNRQQMMEICLSIPDQQLADAYTGNWRKVYQLLLNCGLRQQVLLEDEQTILQNLASHLGNGLTAVQGINYLLAIMLYCQPGQLQIEDVSQIPDWLQTDYQKFM